MQPKTTSNHKGITVAEVLCAVCVIGLFIAWLAPRMMVCDGTCHIEGYKASNAARLTAFANSCVLDGATRGNGETFCIDTSSAKAAIMSMDRGFKINGEWVHFKAVEHPESYTMTVRPDLIIFEARQGTNFKP